MNEADIVLLQRYEIIQILHSKLMLSAIKGLSILVAFGYIFQERIRLLSGDPMVVPGQDNTLHGYLLRWSTSHLYNVHNTQQNTAPQHPFRNIKRFKPHTLVCRYFSIRHILSVQKVAAQEELILTCSRPSMKHDVSDLFWAVRKSINMLLRCHQPISQLTCRQFINRIFDLAPNALLL